MLQRLVPWLVIGLAACTTRPNPALCCTSAADCSSVGLNVDQKACASGLVCTNHTCTAGGECTIDSDCGGATPHCGADHTCVACVDSTQCAGATPVCTSDNTCVGCVDSSDCGGATPICAPDMTCVGCLDSTQCGGATPLCDPSSHTCKGCVVDDDCASKVCDVDAGTCVDGATLVYAAPNGASTGTCPLATPCTFTRAFGIAAATPTRNAVALAPGTYPTVNLTLTGSKTVRLYGAGATATGVFTVQDGATLQVRRLTFDSNTSVECQPTQAGLPMPAIDFDLLDWPQSSGFPLSGNPCSIKLTRSRMRTTTGGSPITAAGEVAGVNGATQNRGSVVSIDRCIIDGGTPGISAGSSTTMTITNSVFANQDPAYGAIQPLGGTSTTVSFSTFYNTLLKCADGAIALSSSNNIYYDVHTGAPPNTVTGTACQFRYDLIAPQATIPGGAGNQIGADPKFVDATNGDFHLIAGSPAIDAADPAATDGHDFDGTPRPQGTANDLGAFEHH